MATVFPDRIFIEAVMRFNWLLAQVTESNFHNFTALIKFTHNKGYTVLSRSKLIHTQPYWISSSQHVRCLEI